MALVSGGAGLCLLALLVSYGASFYAKLVVWGEASSAMRIRRVVGRLFKTGRDEDGSSEFDWERCLERSRRDARPADVAAVQRRCH